MTWLNIGFILREGTGVPEPQSTPKQIGYDLPQSPRGCQQLLTEIQLRFVSSQWIFYTFPVLLLKTRIQLAVAGRSVRKVDEHTVRPAALS